METARLGMRLGEKAVAKGLLTVWGLREALRVQRETARQGKTVPLGAILVKTGLAPRAKVQGLLLEQRLSNLTTPAIRRPSWLLSLRPRRPSLLPAFLRPLCAGLAIGAILGLAGYARPARGNARNAAGGTATTLAAPENRSSEPGMSPLGPSACDNLDATHSTP
ncbi:MAG: hypothetical protein HY608_02870 [Planctomycetes bacterium]|nr:hypothetical protein [Planctomycetota bacterium]